MAFIICDDHNLDVEADGVDNAAAKQLMLTDSKSDATPIEKEIIEFGKIHRNCNIRILAGGPRRLTGARHLIDSRPAPDRNRREEHMKSWVVLAAIAAVLGAAMPLRADDAAQIKNLEANYAAAIRARDIDRLMSNYVNSPDLVVFDLIPPRQYNGWDAYRKDWQGVLAGCKESPVFEVTDLAIDGDKSYAYGRSIQHLKCPGANGGAMDVTFRVTDVYKKIGGKWFIVHEHISVSVDLETGKPDLSSKP